MYRVFVCAYLLDLEILVWNGLAELNTTGTNLHSVFDYDVHECFNSFSLIKSKINVPHQFPFQDTWYDDMVGDLK